MGPPPAGAGPPDPPSDNPLKPVGVAVKESLDEVIKPGRMLFNPPKSMQLNQTAFIDVRITRSQDLDAELSAHLKGTGLPQIEGIDTSFVMGVMLRADGFAITALSVEEQRVRGDGITGWQFNVTALRRGLQSLFLSVSLRLPMAGRDDEYLSAPVIERQVEVQVTAAARAGLFWKKNWQWCIGTLVGVPAAVIAALAIFH
jgi:hypothetical protein